MKKKRKVDIRTEFVLKTLFDGLGEALQTDSIANTFICDVCDKVNVHRTTFYKHFKDKYDLLDQYVRYCLRSVAKIEYDIEEFKSSEEYFLANLDQLFTLIAKHRETLKSILIADADCGEFAASAKEAIRELISDKLGQVEASGQVLSIPNGILSSLYSGAISSIIEYWAFNKNLTKEAIFKSVVSLIK